MEHIQKVIEAWNKTANTDWYMSYRTDDVIQSIIDNPISAFHHTTWEIIKKYIPALSEKKILVPSSGDNRAVFAFAALGAMVTSCDISTCQLEYAGKIAERFNLKIEFLTQDTMTLHDIKSDTYDFVYTSEGVHVWINNLPSMYDNIFRVLKPKGIYVNYEIHPFTRPFAYDDGKPKDERVIIRKPYDSTGPHDNGIEYHWRLQDIINAITSSGLELKSLNEMYDEKDKGHFWFYEDKRITMSHEEIDAFYDWKINPLSALPQWFTVCAIKCNPAK